MKQSDQQGPRILIVGGGVAGLILATGLRRHGLARICLIDRSWVHVWKPMLHTFAAGTWNIYEQQVQYVAHARTHHFEYVPGQLQAIDRAARRIHLAPLQVAGEVVAGRREMDYDVQSHSRGCRRPRPAAKEVGAAIAVDARSPQAIDEVLKATGGGAHGVLVTAPSPKAFSQAFKLARRKGTVALVGLPPGDFPTPIFEVVLKRIYGARLDRRHSP